MHIYKKGIIAGTFDLLHTGHVYTLEMCKKECDYLIVAMLINPAIERKNKNKPIQSSFERFIQLKSCKYVDEIIPYDNENDLINIYSMLDINVRFIGYDHINTNNTGDDICNNRQIETIFIKRYHNFSSSELRGRIYESYRNLF